MQFLTADGKLKILEDETNHSSYFYCDGLNFPKTDSRIRKVELIKGRNPLWLQDRLMYKVYMNKPQDAGGQEGFSNVTRQFGVNYESAEKYVERYIIDSKRRPCLEYDDSLTVKMVDVDSNPIVNLLGQPVPNIPFLTVDIEIDSGDSKLMANPERAEFPVNFIGFEAWDGRRIIFTTSTEPINLPKVMVQRFESEYDMLLAASELIERYPLNATFNGMKFDYLYLHNRLVYHYNLLKEKCVFQRRSVGLDMGATTKKPVHIDVHLYTKNPTIQNYVYNRSYAFNDLDSVGKAIGGSGKLPYDWHAKHSAAEEAAYCLRDCHVVAEILRARECEFFKVMFTICRICKVSPEDLCVWGTSKWVYYMFLWHHARNGFIMPSRQLFDSMLGGLESSTKAVIKGKKFKGAYVMKPKKGLHFNVAVLDYSSLYPSIISRYNLSYETVKVPSKVDCQHEQCKLNVIPDTPYYVCMVNRGIIAEVIGQLRDVRVVNLKPLAAKSSFMACVSRGVKVILNAGYGCLGSDKSQFYFLPVGEAVTAYGRNSINSVIEEAKVMGLTPYMSDTDSLLTENTPRVDDLIGWTKTNLQMDLEKEKVYLWVGLTSRKKNYLGLPEGGKMVVKGLLGRKSHTPNLVKSTVNEVIDCLSAMKGKEDYVNLRIVEGLGTIVHRGLSKVLNGEGSVDEWSFHTIVKGEDYKTSTTIRKANVGFEHLKPEELNDSNSTVSSRTVKPPEHVRALIEAGIAVKQGTVVDWIKTNNGPKMLDKSQISEVNVESYFNLYRTALEQILDALNLSFPEVAGLRGVEEIKPT